MAEGDSTMDVHDSDFESDFVSSQILKSFDVGIDQVTSIAFNTSKRADIAVPGLTIPFALVTTKNYPSQKIYCEKNGEELSFCLNLPNANQSKGNFFNGIKENFEILEVVYTRPGDKYHIRTIQLTTSISDYHGKLINTQTTRVLNNNYTNLFVTGMCDATGGDVASCLVESHSYDVKSDSHRMVRIFDKKRFDNPGFLMGLANNNHPLSQPCRDIEFDGQERLFTYPRRIALSSREDFWVVNRTGEQSGNVTVVGMADGKLKFRYNRRVSNILFDPKDVARNIKETMVIADFRNHAIHLVKDDGTFLQYIMTSVHGLFFPTTVAIDRYDRAWIGCDFGKVHIVRFNKEFE